MKYTFIEQVNALVRSAVAGSDIELVDVEYIREGKRLRVLVTIDRASGVRIDDCQWVSDHLSPLLDAEDPIPGQYVLEVSSPGLTRPLKREQDYHRFAGRLVKLRLAKTVRGRRVLIGTLNGLAEGVITLTLATGDQITVPLEQVTHGNLEFQQPNPKRGRKQSG